MGGHKGRPKRKGKKVEFLKPIRVVRKGGGNHSVQKGGGRGPYFLGGRVWGLKERRRGGIVASGI